MINLGDILVDRNLSNDEVVATMSELFSVSPADILIVDDIYETKVSAHIRILCERMTVSGEFLIKLDFYLRDPKLKKLEPEPIIKQFCSMLHCKCLISDSSVNPYSMLLVRKSGDVQPVGLDPIRLDENEEYIILK